LLSKFFRIIGQFKRVSKRFPEFFSNLVRDRFNEPSVVRSATTRRRESPRRKQVSAGGSAGGTTSLAAFMTIRGPKAHGDRRKRLRHNLGRHTSHRMAPPMIVCPFADNDVDNDIAIAAHPVTNPRNKFNSLPPSSLRDFF
jgi:hypothetical protein